MQSNCNEINMLKTAVPIHLKIAFYHFSDIAILKKGKLIVKQANFNLLAKQI